VLVGGSIVAYLVLRNRRRALSVRA
jgi:hypothetical protein